ncbi:MAG: hypothetical protein E7302_09300 [Butyrivibrio sp.]|nr:hypothetical protein [Butyrivibrio sp.]
MNINDLKRKAIILGLALAMGCGIGCGNNKEEKNETPPAEAEIVKKEWSLADGFIREAEDSSTDPVFGQESEGGLSNAESTLSVPTYIDKLGDDWFIVDCYHNQIIYNDNLETPLYEWKVLTKNVNLPHTMASDGTVYLLDDTENNRVLVFEKDEDSYKCTQLFNEIGQRPHYVVYDEDDKAFYVWSSTTGEMYIFRRDKDSSKMYLTEIRRVGGSTLKGNASETSDNTGDDSVLNGAYIRSFFIDGDDIYFVSGITAQGTASGIIKCNKYTMEIKEQISVPDELAGMAYMRYDAPYYYITVSTDVTGSQDAATMLRTDSLDKLMAKDYEVIYDTYFVGGGTPYNIFKVDDTYYLTEHRLPAHAIWSYRIDEKGNIEEVESIY